MPEIPGVCLEVLCFQAKQAGERCTPEIGQGRLPTMNLRLTALSSSVSSTRRPDEPSRLLIACLGSCPQEGLIPSRCAAAGLERWPHGVPGVAESARRPLREQGRQGGPSVPQPHRTIMIRGIGGLAGPSSSQRRFCPWPTMALPAASATPAAPAIRLSHGVAVPMLGVESGA